MWQIMWMLSFLPDWFWHVLTVGSLIAAAGPFLDKPKRIGAAILFLICVFMEGGIGNEAKWQARVTELEAKVAQAEAEGKAANAKLDKKSAEKVRVIQGKQIIVKQYIDREVTKYDDACKIPPAVVRAHNAAAKNEELK
jgi:hypothetical protein